MHFLFEPEWRYRNNAAIHSNETCVSSPSHHCKFFPKMLKIRKIKRIHTLSVLTLLLFLQPSLPAETSILYWTDQVIGDDAMAAALDGLATSAQFDSITTATSDAAFAQKIGSGDYDLGILFIQGSSTNYASIDALAQFAAAGGWAMYADWTAAADLAIANQRAAQFGFQYTGNFNQDTLTVIDPSLNSPNEIGGPIDLQSPGWFEYSFGLSVEPGEGDLLAEFGNGEAAVVRTFPGGRVMGIGLLNDVFANHAQGVDFFTNAVYAIPEPGTYAALLGALMLGGTLLRRRRSKRFS